MSNGEGNPEVGVEVFDLRVIYLPGVSGRSEHVVPEVESTEIAEGILFVYTVDDHVRCFPMRNILYTETLNTHKALKEQVSDE